MCLPLGFRPRRLFLDEIVMGSEAVYFKRCCTSLQIAWRLSAFPAPVCGTKSTPGGFSGRLIAPRPPRLQHCVNASQDFAFPRRDLLAFHWRTRCWTAG